MLSIAPPVWVEGAELDTGSFAGHPTARQRNPMGKKYASGPEIGHPGRMSAGFLIGSRRDPKIVDFRSGRKPCIKNLSASFAF